jgi:hypothetical protein
LAGVGVAAENAQEDGFGRVDCGIIEEDLGREAPVIIVAVGKGPREYKERPGLRVASHKQEKFIGPITANEGKRPGDKGALIAGEVDRGEPRNEADGVAVGRATAENIAIARIIAKSFVREIGEKEAESALVIERGIAGRGEKRGV